MSQVRCRFPRSDLDGSGKIDAGDIDQLICLWGECTFW